MWPGRAVIHIDKMITEKDITEITESCLRKFTVAQLFAKCDVSFLTSSFSKNVSKK